MEKTGKPTRLYSLDALRGFDMLWIMGAGALICSIADATGSTFWETIAIQLEHPEWNGFRFYDIIFPLFLFLAGVSTPYSIGRQLEKGKTKKELLIKVIKRGLVLILLGVIYNNGLHIMPIAEVRFGSVLGRIGLAYMFANIIYIYTKQLGQIVWIVALLIGYWLLFIFGSAPGFEMGDLTMEGNIVSYLDRVLMPGKLYKGIHDPEGLFATIPAIATALLGIYTGTLLKSTSVENQKKSAIKIASIGAILIVLAQIWNLILPINKNLWSSSFTLQCGGISMLLMALFYYIIDILGYKKWAFFFKVIGMNSILIYMSSHFIDWHFSASALFGWIGDLSGDPYGAVAIALGVVVIKWCFLNLLYKKNIFLKV